MTSCWRRISRHSSTAATSSARRQVTTPYRTDYRKAWEPATGENPQADGDRPVCNWATEFHIHTGGTSAEYVESLGMTGWGSSGNTSTRPGYIKCGGGGGGIGILYTPR
ncbi:MAG: hypothetical protein ACLT1W_00960 [Alistipes onderdonkii]